MLFSALTMSAATQYCDVLLEAADGDVTYSLYHVSGNTYGIQVVPQNGMTLTGIANPNIGVNQSAGAGITIVKDLWTISNNVATAIFQTASENSVPTNFFTAYICFNKTGGKTGRDLVEITIPATDIDWTTTCGTSGETPDTEAPVMTSATFVSASDKSVVIAVEATDNVKVASYLVKNGDVELGSFTVVNNNITVNGLEPGTTYQLTVYAKDASDNISAEGIIVEVTTTSIPMSPFCDTEIGHEGNVNADPNSFILLSVGSDGAGHTIVTIRQDAAKNTSMFDYINIVGIKEIGSDIATGGSDAMGILFNTPTPDAEGNITFMIQWSIINWGGRWQYNVTLPAEAICANVDPYPSEPYLYCSYTDNNLKSGNANVALTWATDASGNVVIDIEDGEGASNSAFRNGGFELGGGLSFADSWKVYSGTNHQTVEDATVYFNEGGTLSNNDKRYTLTKKAEAVLPANAVIVWMGHAFSWKNDQAGGAYYIGKTFAYSYGESCPSLETPTNVAVSEEGIITFTGSALAETYTASVYLGGILKYRQDVTNGGTLNYTPYVSGTYQVTVTASATGYPTTAPSEPFDWQRTVVPASPTNSAYCEQEMSNGNTLAKFTWETDDNGNIIITIAEALGGESSASIFRANGFNLSNLRVGTHSPGSDYFTSSWVGSVQTLALKDPNVKPGIGEPITYNGIVEYSTSGDQNAYPTLQFNDYLYGAKCEGQKRVTASVNDAAMGTAKVNGQDEVYVDPDTEATFTATPNDGYVFVNWTKGDEVVSTSATYTTTITSALSLVANFDYERIAYCHYEVLATGGDAAGKKLYLTLGSNGTGKYYIKFEGSVEAPLASLNNANYMVNGVSTDILIDGVTSSGQDVPFTKANGRWNFDAAGYGSAMMEFSLADGKTISDIFVWNNFIAFGVVGGGELIYEDNQDRNKLFGNPAPLRYSIDWDNVCVDDEAPVLVAPQAKALNATDVQLTLKATDNWDGLITYNISYHPTSDASSPVIVSTTGASAEEITYDILALTTGVEYTFTITASDGTNTSAAQTCVVTPASDTEKPIMGTATLVSSTHYMAVIAVTATDNQKVDKYRVVDATNAYDKVLVPTEGQITLTDLTAATAYNFTITAIDLAGNESENAATVECTTNNAKPTSAPTPPTHDAKQVRSVFSDVYGGTFSAMEGWGQATQFEELNFDGDHVRYYTNLNYLGWATGSPINASVMEKLHLDIWAAEDATIIIVPIYGGQGLVTDDKKTKTVTLKGQEWNSIDLTLATDFAGLDLSSIFQFKFDAPQGTDKFAIDNVYFYTTQVSSDVTPPTNITATAVPSFTTAVINCQATDESGSISYKVYLGAELKGTGSADSGKTAAITATNLQPNREFTMTVIATDVYGNEAAEPVNVTFTTLAYPAPAPTPIWTAENVFSIYSDAYVPQANRAFGWWGASTVEAEAELATGDNALLYTTSTYLGWSLNNDQTIGDISAYPYFHMDIYVENAGSIQFTPIWGAEALKTYTLQAGWNSIDIDLVAEFTGINLANIYQLKWAAMPATCFIDNVYFYKEVHQEVTESLEITEDYAYTSLTITEDGKVTISNGATLTVKDFVIQSTMGAGESGQLLGATLDNFDLIGDAYIDITLGKDAAADQWHAFTVPFPVNALNGIYKTDGTKLRNEVDYAIMDYHGDIRANGKYGWKKYRGDLVPGTFYIMTVNGDIKTFRFKKTDGSSVVAANNKDLVAHNGSGTDTDKGWNGVGNPTLAYGSVAQAVQVLNPETYTYEAHEANATNFTVGTPFFIQAASNGNMTMAVADASKPSYAPARQQTTEVKAKVYLSNDNYTDRLYITATDDATATYEIGKDLVKMTMTNTPNVPQLFARAYNTDLCMIHTPLSNNEAMVALNLYAPAAGEYTLSAEVQNGETIYLLKDNAIIWNLTASEYTIDLSQGNTEVYGVAIKRAPQVETGIDNGATIQTLPSKVILQGNLYILHNGQMYDVTGKCVK